MNRETVDSVFSHIRSRPARIYVFEKDTVDGIVPVIFTAEEVLKQSDEQLKRLIEIRLFGGAS